MPTPHPLPLSVSEFAGRSGTPATMDTSKGGTEACGITPFPSVAVELVRGIMEVAACMDKQTALSLARVSRAVNVWIKPIIYHTVVLRYSEKFDAFDRTLRECPAAGLNVRCLITDTDVPFPGISADTLRACVNLATLATGSGLGVLTATGNQLWPALSHIMLVAPKFHQVPPTGHALLHHATHLYVDYPNAAIFDVIAFLPQLTHVGFGCWSDSEEVHDLVPSVERILERGSIMNLLVYAFAGEGGELIERMVGPVWMELTKIQDARLFAIPALSMEERIALLEAGDTIWNDAKRNHQGWRQLVDEDGSSSAGTVASL